MGEDCYDEKFFVLVFFLCQPLAPEVAISFHCFCHYITNETLSLYKDENVKGWTLSVYPKSVKIASANPISAMPGVYRD